MNFTSESVMHDIEAALRERSEEEWSNTDRLLLKAQLHIASLQRQLDHKELTDEEVIKIIKRFIGTEPLVHEIEQAVLRKAQKK